MITDSCPNLSLYNNNNNKPQSKKLNHYLKRITTEKESPKNIFPDEYFPQVFFDSPKRAL